MPTQTLAELHLAALPGGNHLLTVEAGEPPPDAVFQAFADYLESIRTGSSNNLALRTRATGILLPDHLILVPVASDIGGCIIYYPSHGLVAGIRADGTKIPPAWKEPIPPPSPERTAILQQAADILVRAIYDITNKAK